MGLSSPLDPAFLAREAEGIRRLARALLADAHRADDAAQETMRVALERGPRPGFESRAWLRGVLRNVVRRTRRTDARRLAREGAAAVPDVAPAATSNERLARRKAVLDAVLVLPETLRTAIELRFFEGLPPRAIARRLGVPVETCRTRVRRGLESLRRELDRREGGDGRRWARALAPLAVPARGFAVPLGVGGLLMAAKAKVAVVAVLLAVLGFAALRLTAERRGETTDPGVRTTSSAPPETAGGLATADPATRPLAGTTRTEAALGRFRLRISGLVTDAEGEPIPGARVHAGSADRFDDLSRAPDATTDAAGRFVLDRTGPDVAWRVQASAPGRRTAGTTASAGTERDVVLRLSRTVPLWLSVRDLATDAPIEGAEVVMIAADEGGRREERARTDAEGLASVVEPGVRPVDFEFAAVVRVTAEGHAPHALPLGSHGAPGSTTRERPHRVALRPAAPLLVRVVTAEGKPVAGATVFGWGAGHVGSVASGTSFLPVEGGAQPLGPVESDAEGHARLGVPTDPWYLFATRGDDVAFLRGSGTSREVEMRLSPGLTVDGVVLDERSAPLGGVRVRMDWDGWFRSSPDERVPNVPPEMVARFEVRTDAEGRFVLAGLPRPSGSKPLFVSAEADGPRFGGARIEPADGVTRATVRIELKRYGDPWPFRVRSSAGVPIPGALVRIPYSYPAARTGVDGLALLPIGPGSGADRGVVVDAPGFARGRAPLPAVRPTEPLEIVLEPEAVLDAVVWGSDGRPAVGAWVAVVADGPDDQVETSLRDRASAHRLADRLTDADGRVRVEALPRSPVWVAAEATDPGYPRVPEADRNRRVVRLALPGPVEIRLPRPVFDRTRGSVVEGEVVEEDGSPVRERYSAALQSPTGAIFPAASTGRRFRFEGIPPGRWQLQIYLSGVNVPVLADVETEAGREVGDLRVVRTRPGRIVGRVVAAGASNLEGLPVHAVDTRGIGHVRGRATTETGGTFRVEGLPPGTYRVVLEAPKSGRLPFVALDGGAVEVGPGAETRVEVQAAPAARLVLLCDDERLAPRPERMENPDFVTPEYRTNVVLTWPDGRSETAFGLYRGRNETPWPLAPGRYRLRVRRLEEFTTEVVADRTGDIEVPVVFGTPPR